MKGLIEADENLLMAINGAHSEFMDFVMFWVSDKFIWIPLYVVFVAMIVSKKGVKSAFIYLLFIILTIWATDQTCCTVIRPLVERLRPCAADNPISPMIHSVIGSRYGTFGFPSAHAANTFALAMFLSLLFRKKWLTCLLFLWAFMVSYSRVYLAAHYPGDILAGFMVGGIYALAFFYVASYLQEHNFALNPWLKRNRQL